MVNILGESGGGSGPQERPKSNLQFADGELDKEFSEAKQASQGANYNREGEGVPISCMAVVLTRPGSRQFCLAR